MEFRHPPLSPPLTPLANPFGPSSRIPLRPARYVSDLVVVAGLVAILVLAMAVLGRLKTIFMDFHIVLPAVTRSLLDLHGIYTDFYGWALVWVIPLVAPLLLAQAGPRSRRRWFLAGYVLVGLLIVAMFLALMFPLASLIQGISGPRQPPGD